MTDNPADTELGGKQYLSDCHQAPTRSVGGRGDFRDEDTPITMSLECTVCDQPCNLYIPPKEEYQQPVDGKKSSRQELREKIDDLAIEEEWFFCDEHGSVTCKEATAERKKALGGLDHLIDEYVAEERQTSFIKALQEQNPADQLLVLGALLHQFLMEETNATKVNITLDNFSRHGKVLGDLRLDIKLVRRRAGIGGDKNGNV